MYSFKICLIEKNTYSIKKYYTAILHQDSAFSDLSICLCKSEFHARTIFRYSKYHIILFFLKSKTSFYWPLFWSDICNIYIHIYIYIHTILPVNAIISLPHPRRRDSHAQETFLTTYIYIYIYIYVYIYVYIYQAIDC